MQVNASNSFEVYVGLDNIIIKTSSKTKDEKGRYIPYEYYVSLYDNTDAVLDTFMSDVKKAGLDINEGDVDALKWVIKNLSLEKHIILGILSACIIIPIFVKLLS